MTPTGEIKIGTLLKKIKKCDKQYVEIKVHKEAYEYAIKGE